MKNLLFNLVSVLVSLPLHAAPAYTPGDLALNKAVDYVVDSGKDLICGSYRDEKQCLRDSAQITTNGSTYIVRFQEIGGCTFTVTVTSALEVDLGSTSQTWVCPAK